VNQFGSCVLYPPWWCVLVIRVVCVCCLVNASCASTSLMSCSVDYGTKWPTFMKLSGMITSEARTPTHHLPFSLLISKARAW
jgi:hypothetical protein